MALTTSAAVIVFLLLAAMPPAILDIDLRLADTLRNTVSLPMLDAVAVLTRLGNFETLASIVAALALLLILRGEWARLTVWLGVTVGNGLMNAALKLYFARPRPLHDHGPVLETAYSFPSGHASGSLAVYGLLGSFWLGHARPVLRRPIAVGIALLVLAIGASRVILQVHYLSDVLAGYALAAGVLAIGLGMHPRHAEQGPEQPEMHQ